MTRTNIDFTRLPERTRERIRRRIANPGMDTRLFSTEGRTHLYVGLGLALLLGWFVLATVSDPYTDLTAKLVAACATVAILSWCAAALYARWKEPVRGAGYFTRIHLVRTKRGQVRFRPWIRHIEKVDASRDGNGRVNALLLTFGQGDVETIPVRSGEDGQALLGFLSESETSVVEAASRTDLDTLRDLDDFLDVAEEADPERPHWSRSALGAKAGALALGLAALSSVGVVRSHDYAVDLVSWESALAEATATSFRTYLAEKPKGRWRQAANDSIDAAYANAAQAYEANLSAGHDVQAVAAIQDLLQYARTTGVYRVPVAFQGTNQLPDYGSTESFVLGGRTIYNYGDSFATTRQRERESSVLFALQSAIASVVPGDVLTFVEAGDSVSALVVVEYQVRETGSIYVESTSSGYLSEGTETGRAFRGVFFTWRCTIQSPSSDRRYQLRLQSEPATSIDTDRAADVTPVETVYNYMAQSAFHDFQANLARRVGLATPTDNSR